ncbi:MAG: recombinase-like helix-turn-helix domain-containing protein [Pseudomonadota bacterium]
MTEWNPWLAPDAAAGARGTKGGEATVELPGTAPNVVWQTRASPPTDGENRLADALQAIFADEIYDLPGIVARLNRAGLTTPAGAPWTESEFTTEMARLGARAWDRG